MEFRRKKKENTDITLSDGIVMKQPLQMETSSWLRNCMVKSLLVFSVVFGCLGCFLSSLDVEYYVIPTAVILFAIALLFTTIYYRGWLMDAVYIVFLAIFFFLVQGLKVYINSGYYLIVNRVFETVENYFDLPGMQYYEIGADNEILAVSVIVIFVGIVMMVVTNVIISRTMNVWFLLVMTGAFWIVPLYFRLEPDALYAILMLTGYLAVWSIHSSGAYGMDRKHRDYQWKDKKGKKLRIWYVQDAETMLGTIGAFAGVILLLYGITAAIGDKDTFNIRYRQNQYKEQSEENVQEIATRGFSVFNRYDAVGGMSGGQLGGVASVSPDYQTDLIVRFAPYSYEPVYLKGYTGVDYVSSESRWQPYEIEESSASFSDFVGDKISISEEQKAQENYTFGDDCEAQVLQNQELADGSGAVAKIQILNMGAYDEYPYIPYYTPAYSSVSESQMCGEESNQLVEVKIDDTEDQSGSLNTFKVRFGNAEIQYGNLNIITGTLEKGQWTDYEYYPLLKKSSYLAETDLTGTVDAFEQAQQQAESAYLNVPEECYEAVAKASAEAGIEADDSQEEIIQKVKDYFESEFLYTTRPGRTPGDMDFITHFLEKKKGYCAHFATAATMIYRYNGIPARYVEGYVITYEDIMNSELADECNYDDFYQGESLLGETGVVEVQVTDARAHAWVEVFDSEFGWICEEVTTAAVDPDEELESFWDIFADGGNSDEESGVGEFNLETMDLDLDDIQGIWIGLIIVLGLLGVFYCGRKGYHSWKQYQSWHTENGNENVVAYYHIISERLRKKDSGYAQCPTYRKQIAYMAKHCETWNWDTENLTELLETACYSKDGISEFDCKRVMLELADIEKKVKKWKHSKKL